VARRFSSDIDLLKFSLLNAMLNPVSSDPTLVSGDAGRVWYNTTTPTLKFWNGTTAIDLLARGTHTGTQTASTISDLSTVVHAYTLDTFAAAAADVSLASHKLTNVTDPTGAQDAATKNYVDQSVGGITGGLTLKGTVVCAPPGNISLTTPGATIDGITMSNPMTILLANQTTLTQNGPYVWTGPSIGLVRAPNWTTSAQATLGSFWIVEQGSQADMFAILTNDTAITIGTSSPAFTFNGNGSALTGSSSVLVSGGVASAIVASGGGLIGDSTHALAPDFTIVARKVVGTIPATTSAPFTVTGSSVVFNHALNNSAPVFVIRAGSVPISGYTQGQLVEMDNIATDANNITITLPATPIANNWAVTAIG
jgi:hypothetical protein